MKQDIRRARSGPWTLLGLLGVTTAAGCAPADNRGNDGGDSAVRSDGAARACTPDPARIAARRECRADDQCPCGAHCALGQCVAQCASSADCTAGQTCDVFGRCVAPGRARTERIADPSAPGDVVLDAPLVELASLSTPAQIAFRASSRGISAWRIAAPAGWELQCEPGGAFVSECRGEALARAQERRVQARPRAGATPNEVGTFRLYWGSQMRTVGVRPPGLAVRSAGRLAGRYRGSATLVDVSLGARAGAPVRPVTMDLSIPIEASVFVAATGGQGTIAIDDAVGALVPSKRWVGTMMVDAATGAGTIALPRQQIASPTINDPSNPMAWIRGLEANAVAAPEPAAYQFDARTQTVTMTVAIPIEGVVEGDRATTLRWRFDLARLGDLPSGATAPTVSPAAALPPSRIDAASPWETQARGLFRWSAARDPADARWLLQSMGDAVPAGVSYRTEICGAGAAFGTADYGHLIGSTFQNGSESPFANVPSLTAAMSLESSGAYLHAAIVRSANNSTVQSVSVREVGAFPASGIPCEFTIDPQPNGCGMGVNATFGTVNRCAEISRQLGCVVEDAAANTRMNFEYSLQATGGSCPQRGSNIRASAVVSRVCRAPRISNCGELVACMFDDGFTTSAGARVLPNSGDVECRAATRGTPSASRTLATLADLDRERGVARSTAQVVADSLADVTRLRGAPAVSGATLGDRMRSLVGSPSSYDAVRALVALSYATDAGRARARGMADSDVRGARLAQRILQQWLAVHGRIANESAQRAAVPAAIRGAATDTLVPTPIDALTASLNGWDLVLHPRFASALEAMEPAALDLADYRIQSASPSDIRDNPDHEQGHGVVLAMLRALRAQLDLDEVILDRAARAGDGTIPPVVGRSVRVATMILPWVEELHARASAAARARGGALPWENRFVSERGQLIGSLRRVIGATHGIITRRNPLGIEEVDTPLYLFGASADPRQRFSAVSDYLLGVGPMSPGWAPSLVEQAQTAAATVGTQYQLQATRAYQQQLSARDNEDRLSAIRSQYGSQIASLCGVPQGLASYDALERWPDFDGNRCYIRSELSACRPSTAQLDALLTAGDVQYQLCVATEVNRRTPGMIEHLSADAAAFIASQTEQSIASCTYPVACGVNTCVRCNSQEIRVSTGSMSALLAYMAQNNSASLAAAQSACALRYPTARRNLPSFDELADNPLARSECYRGSMGELAMAIRSATTDVEIARAQQSESVENYNIAMRSCALLASGNASVEQAIEDHNSTMHDLASAKLAFDIAANTARAAKECLQAATAEDGTDYVLTGGAVVALTCVAAGVESVAESISDGLEFGMGEAERKHALRLQRIESDTAERRCVNDAAIHLVGARTAGLRVQRALQDLDAARYRLIEGTRLATQLFVEGRASLEYEQGRQARPPALDAWVDQAITDYRAKMSAARRLAYLAVRAVEYEYQSTSTLRAQVLAAETPAELRSVIDTLRTSAGPRAINGRAPSSLKVVVSLRQHLLQIADRSESTTTVPLTDVERFRLLLQDRRYAQYDESGNYLGQRVPFSIAPLGALRVGDPSGVPIFASNDCAERVWSVNASILGADAVRGGATFARMDLLKSNTFFSQWCSAPTDGPRFQSASVRPAINLFVDPTFSSASGMVGASLGANNGAETFTRARMQPVLNVPRAMFEDDSFSNGMSTELASRGLYGEYALFIPAAQIARRNADGTYSQGIDLDAIDDVLFRIDYVSVAR